MDWSELFKSPLFVIAAVSGLATLVFKAGVWKSKMDSGVSGVERSVEGLRSEMRDFMKEIRSDIKKIFNRLSPTTRIGSPISLTRLGEKVSGEIGAPEWARVIAPKFLDEVSGQSPYFIQEFCMDFCTTRYAPDQDVKARLEQCAYENGIDLDSVLRVLAVELRDRLLELTPSQPTSSA